jgi:hypothetical protein
MAYAGDLKSPDAHASCGFDPHPGHSSLYLKLHQFTHSSFSCTSRLENDERISLPYALEICLESFLT